MGRHKGSELDAKIKTSGYLAPGGVLEVERVNA
jgi:hypothetical protein